MVLAIVTSTSWQSPVVELYTEHIHRVSFLKQTSKHDQVTCLTETSHTRETEGLEKKSLSCLIRLVILWGCRVCVKAVSGLVDRDKLVSVS